LSVLFSTAYLFLLFSFWILLLFIFSETVLLSSVLLHCFHPRFLLCLSCSPSEPLSSSSGPNAYFSSKTYSFCSIYALFPYFSLASFPLLVFFLEQNCIHVHLLTNYQPEVAYTQSQNYD
jgi:hypothetical protein